MLADYSSSHKLSYYATLPRRFGEMFSRLCTRFKPNMVQKAEIALARISYAEK
ncbi:hypothetical protein HMPREF1586_01135 [Gardnerella vaginalis JCP8522]|nr:hypothetical protein HMPREF1586_01135 [Gardnerella vaginalis JCP8522]